MCAMVNRVVRKGSQASGSTKEKTKGTAKLYGKNENGVFAATFKKISKRFFVLAESEKGVRMGRRHSVVGVFCWMLFLMA